MYKELTTHDIAHALSSDEANCFSYRGAYALAQELEEMEIDTGEKTELDTVAIRCEFSEYPSAYEAMQQYQPDDMPIEGEAGDDLLEIEEKNEKAALEWLRDQTMVIPFDGGVIIQDF